MSAMVLGKRSPSCFFEDLHHHPATVPPPISTSKRPRSGASPPPLFWPPHPSISSSPAGVASPSDGAVGVDSGCCASHNQTLLFHLRSLFPNIEEQLLEGALEASGGDLDSAIRSLKDLHMGSTKGSLESADHVGDISGTGAAENPLAVNNLPSDGSEWVELLVREMMHATDIDVARMRASRLLQVLEKSIMTQASAEVVQTFRKENLILKERVDELLHDNSVLKRAVAIQHERQREFDGRNEELQHLKQLVAQYQEHLRTLEINNYALSMHLRQAQEGASIPGRFHPDVF